jgi:hypothetical protein
MAFTTPAAYRLDYGLDGLRMYSSRYSSAACFSQRQSQSKTPTSTTLLTLLGPFAA